MTRENQHQQLEELIGSPSEMVRTKILPQLDRFSRRFIELCPFLCLGSASGETADVSPRGDPPGFIKIIDNKTLLIPDRPGNKRVDSMRNIIDNPYVGLLLFIPGVAETLRISGRASWTTDPALLIGTDVAGRAPKVGILIEIGGVHFHCAKAILRSSLWDASSQIERSDFPSVAEIVLGQREDKAGIVASADETAKLDKLVDEVTRNSMY